jgi:protein-disulfide isomerase
VYPVLEQLLEKYPNDVNLVIKHYPLTKIHDFAENASLAALAASRQNKYRELSKVLMANYKKLSDETISQHAEEVGLNMETFNKDYNDPSLKNQVRGDLRLGSSVGVRGVPGVYINGRVVKGSSLQGFSRIVEQELKENR